MTNLHTYDEYIRSLDARAEVLLSPDGPALLALDDAMPELPEAWCAAAADFGARSEGLVLIVHEHAPILELGRVKVEGTERRVVSVDQWTRATLPADAAEAHAWTLLAYHRDADGCVHYDSAYNHLPAAEGSDMTLGLLNSSLHSLLEQLGISQGDAVAVYGPEALIRPIEWILAGKMGAEVLKPGGMVPQPSLSCRRGLVSSEATADDFQGLDPACIFSDDAESCVAGAGALQVVCAEQIDISDIFGNTLRGLRSDYGHTATLSKGTVATMHEANPVAEVPAETESEDNKQNKISQNIE